MNPDLLCQWLGLPTRAWPPDPHTLVGVAPQERDPANIERHVHDRMLKLRGYQISHPEEATEGMNRLAQAFVALMESETSTATPEEAVFTPIAPAAAETVIEHKTRIDWQSAPPPVRSTPIVRPAAQAPKVPVDPVVELAQESAEARAGLRTLEAVIKRADRTRQMLLSWERVGWLMRDSRRPLKKAAKEKELVRHLQELVEQIEHFPKIIGRPGKPGYRVVAMARLEMSTAMFRALDKPQRELLAVDWTYGRAVLLSHRKYLLNLFKRMRRRGALRLAIHAARSFLQDYPTVVFMILLVISLAAAWIRWR